MAENIRTPLYFSNSQLVIRDFIFSREEGWRHPNHSSQCASLLKRPCRYHLDWVASTGGDLIAIPRTSPNEHSKEEIDAFVFIQVQPPCQKNTCMPPAKHGLLNVTSALNQLNWARPWVSYVNLTRTALTNASKAPQVHAWCFLEGTHVSTLVCSQTWWRT